MKSLLQQNGPLTDREIVRLSTKPEKKVYINALGGLIEQGYFICAPYTAEESALIDGARSPIRDYVSITDATFHDKNDFKPMIEPFQPGQVRYTSDKPGFMHGEGHPVISFGTSSFGYDIRVAPEFKIFTNINSTVIDPKDFDPNCFVDFKGDCCIIPPNSFVLARSMEYFRMPKNVMGLVLAKSTYARTGQACLATPLEPGWEGHITLEFANNTPLPMKLYAKEGGAQVVFFRGDYPNRPYDNTRKYQGQTGITLPKV